MCTVDELTEYVEQRTSHFLKKFETDCQFRANVHRGYLAIRDLVIIGYQCEPLL